MRVKILLIVFSLCLCFVVPSVCNAQKNSVEKRVGVISFWPYSPDSIGSLNELPPEIAAKVSTHLINHLGEQFYKRLRFTYGVRVNFEDLYRITPGARSYQWKIFTYRLAFTFGIPEVGIKAYEADIWLDEKGGVIKEIDLPAIGQQPEKARIIPIKEALLIGKGNGFRASRVEIAYRDKEDVVVWRLKRYTGNGFTCELDISAHTGEILNSVSYKGIS